MATVRAGDRTFFFTVDTDACRQLSEDLRRGMDIELACRDFDLTYRSRYEVTLTPPVGQPIVFEWSWVEADRAGGMIGMIEQAVLHSYCSSCFDFLVAHEVGVCGACEAKAYFELRELRAEIVDDSEA